jgi:diacylglycerol kinase family enzyme
MVHSSVPLGILPGGTANVLATEIGLANNLERAARLIPQCVGRRIALGRLDSGGNRRHFLSMAGVGFDARIVYELSAGLKQRLGKIAYWIGGLGQTFRHFPEFEVEIDGQRPSVCSFALVSRVGNYGGDFTIAQSANLFDDEFEVVLFRGQTSPSYVKYLCGMIAGRLAGMRGVSFLKARRVRIFDPHGRGIFIQVDGEHAGKLPAILSLVPDALTLLLPLNYFRQGHAIQP